MRTDYIAHRLLILKDTSTKMILVIDMVCPNEYNKVTKRDEQIRKSRRLCLELRERQEGCMVKLIPTTIGFRGGIMKELKDSIRQIFEYDNNDKELE